MARAMRCAANLLVLGIGTLVAAGQAAALTPLTANSSAGSVSTNVAGAVSDAEVFCPTGTPCGGYSAMASASGAGGGALSVTVTLSGVPFYGNAQQSPFYTTATANVSYGIMLMGTFGVQVPVFISSYVYAASASGYLSDGASLTVANQVGDQAYTKSCYDGYCQDSTNTGFGGTVDPGGASGPVTLTAGFEYLVRLQASATAEINGTVDAMVDPTFTIDPAYAGRFQLVGVPGMAAAVPEPTSWLMMLAGFAAAGIALRRLPRGVPIDASV